MLLDGTIILLLNNDSTLLQHDVVDRDDRCSVMKLCGGVGGMFAIPSHHLGGKSTIAIPGSNACDCASFPVTALRRLSAFAIYRTIEKGLTNLEIYLSPANNINSFNQDI